VHAEILTIGDELCRGEIVDTNSSNLAARLWDLDITTRWMTSCCDDEVDILEALTRAVARADLVVCSGGLGPTEDDLTVDAVARLAGVEAVHEPAARAKMEAFFAGRVAVTPIQLRQVRIPAGARVHANPLGLAPCFELVLHGVPVICLPGFPREIAGILDNGLFQRFRELREARGNVEHIARRIYRVFGRGESQISQSCRGLIAEGDRTTTLHYQVKFPEVLVKLVVRGPDRGAADARLAALDEQLRERLAPYLYGVGDETLVERVMRRLLAAKRTVATAESCTGGMVGELLTRQPGSSAAFRGGAITYSNEEKQRQLGVRADTLAQHGAVSEETVEEMAAGALERFGVDLAVAVSGVAGPDGGTPDKPVGTVWLALAVKLPKTGLMLPWTTATRMLSWPSTREQIRTLSAWWALAMIDAALPAADRQERARALWILDDKKPEEAIAQARAEAPS
jgi:competence/damage-inducible protein CinA-like protein